MSGSTGLQATGSSPPLHEHNDPVSATEIALLAALVAVAVALYVLVVRGSVTVDFRIGRRVRPLGPLIWQIAAPRELVFDVVAAPYLGRTPRALERKLRVLERSEGMVLAEHYTPVGPVVTTTLETVRFERPERVHFRLVRGPVPYVVEQFTLRVREDGTELEYTGELGTDLWTLGRVWGYFVARRWEATVRSSLAAVKTEAERRAARRSPGRRMTPASSATGRGPSRSSREPSRSGASGPGRRAGTSSLRRRRPVQILAAARELRRRRLRRREEKPAPHQAEEG